MSAFILLLVSRTFRQMFAEYFLLENLQAADTEATGNATTSLEFTR